MLQVKSLRSRLSEVNNRSLKQSQFPVQMPWRGLIFRTQDTGKWDPFFHWQIHLLLKHFSSQNVAIQVCLQNRHKYLPTKSQWAMGLYNGARRRAVPSACSVVPPPDLEPGWWKQSELRTAKKTEEGRGTEVARCACCWQSKVQNLLPPCRQTCLYWQGFKLVSPAHQLNQ